MADIASGGFKKKGYFVFLIIKGDVFPFNSCNLFDSPFLKCAPAVDPVKDDGCQGYFAAIGICIIKYPLDLDGRELRIDIKGFHIGADGFPAYSAPGIYELIPY